MFYERMPTERNVVLPFCIFIQTRFGDIKKKGPRQRRKKLLYTIKGGFFFLYFIYIYKYEKKKIIINHINNNLYSTPTSGDVGQIQFLTRAVRNM